MLNASDASIGAGSSPIPQEHFRKITGNLFARIREENCIDREKFGVNREVPVRLVNDIGL